MKWFKSNWQWAALNLFAVFALVWVTTQGDLSWNRSETFDPLLESGKWSVRFLLICLAMTPLNTYFGWRSAIKLRKPAGIWAFGFALLHVLYQWQVSEWAYITLPISFFIVLGLVGLCILTALALTSNRLAMQRLGKNWKRLHRTVYLAGIAITCHAILATSMSKIIMVRDPHVQPELYTYLALLIIVLTLRISIVKRLLKQIPLRLRRQRAPQPAPVVWTLPNQGPDYVPDVYWRELDLSSDDLSIDVESDAQTQAEREIVH